MTEFFSETLNISEMPWWVGLFGMILTATLSFAATRLTSKDRSQSVLVTQTVKRQKDLDDRTDRLIDDFQEEVSALRKDHQLMRIELNEERKKMEKFDAKITELEKKNIYLIHENETLRKSLENLEVDLKKMREELDEERKKTYSFRNTVRALEKENTELRKENKMLRDKLTLNQIPI